MVFSDKIGIIELYHIDVHQIYILLWHHLEKYNWNIFTYIFHTFKYIFYSKLFYFQFFSIPSHWIWKWSLAQVRTFWALQLCYTSNINFMMSSYWKIQLRNCYPIHFPYIPIYFLLEKLLCLIFLETSRMNLKMVFSKKIALVELYNCGVHHIYILWWLHFETVN